MIKDIVFPEVEGIAVAVVQEHEGLDEFNVYLINLKQENIKNVLITSTGYGLINEEHKKTSTLRHFFEEIKGHDFMTIEPITKDVFGLSNEYWVSFTLNNQLFDKKFVFLAETIVDSNFVTVPVVNKKGVIIK